MKPIVLGGRVRLAIFIYPLNNYPANNYPATLLDRSAKSVFITFVLSVCAHACLLRFNWYQSDTGVNWVQGKASHTRGRRKQLPQLCFEARKSSFSSYLPHPDSVLSNPGLFFGVLARSGCIGGVHLVKFCTHSTLQLPENFYMKLPGVLL